MVGRQRVGVHRQKGVKEADNSHCACCAQSIGSSLADGWWLLYDVAVVVITDGRVYLLRRQIRWGDNERMKPIPVLLWCHHLFAGGGLRRSPDDDSDREERGGRDYGSCRVSPRRGRATGG